MRLRIIDAFTDQPFSGNPAGVCLLEGERWPSEDWMRRVAAELNLSETAFAYRLPDSGSAQWALRWFTPAVEVDLCGHATLATAQALHDDGHHPGTVSFHTRSGVLVTHTRPNGAITLDFPAATLTPTPADQQWADALGAPPQEMFSTGQLSDLLIVMSDLGTVADLAPDIAAVGHLSRAAGIRGAIVTAPAPPRADFDYVSRFFAPAAGINEDPVTGSAHTALAPYWSRRLNGTRLTGRQVSARGGTVHTEVRGDRVLLSGHAVTVLDGTLQGTAAG